MKPVATGLLLCCVACSAPKFTASPLRLLVGQATVLAWSASGPCTLTSTPDVTGTMSLPSAGTRQLEPATSCQLFLRFDQTQPPLEQDLVVHAPAQPFPLVFTFYADPAGGLVASVDLTPEVWGAQTVETFAFRANEPGARPITFSHDGKQFHVDPAAGYRKSPGERLPVAGHWEARAAALPTEHEGPRPEQVAVLHFNLCLAADQPH